MTERTAKYTIGTVFDDRGTKAANKAFDDLGKKTAAMAKQLAAVGAAAAAAGAALVAGLVKSGLESIDTQAKLARQLGGTIDGLRGLQLAGDDAGISQEELTSAMEKLNARLGEAQRGVGTAKAALDALGLSASALSKMDTDQRMATIADRVKELGLSSSQTADLLRQLGIRNTELVELMRNGGDAIRAARKEVDDFGLSVSEVDAAKIEAANDAMSRIGRVMESIRNQITIAFAPLLTELAERFNNVARENQGFGNVARATTESMISGFAKVADVIHVLHGVLKGAELIVVTMKATWISVAEAIVRAWAAVADGLVKTTNLGIRGLNALGASIEELKSPSDSGFVKGLREMGAEARAEIARVRMELVDLVSAEWPSDQAEEFLAAVRARAQEAAEAMAAAQAGGGTFVSTDEEAEKKAKKDEERRLKELETAREAMVERLNQVIEFAAAEDEIEQAQHEERLASLREGLEAELITEEEFQIAKQVLEEKHQTAMAEIRKKGMTDLEKFTNASYSKQVGMVSGYLADITAGVARENKAMFELNKAAGIANAIVSMYEGISKTLGAYPYPINLGLAAAHAIAAAAQVKAIASQSFGSRSTSAPSLAGGTPATPVTPVNGGTPASGGTGGSLLTVEGISPDALFSGRTVRALAERLAEHQRDGGTVQFAT
jgi:hypothetical protein